jgi:hypothetical protein
MLCIVQATCMQCLLPGNTLLTSSSIAGLITPLALLPVAEITSQTVYSWTFQHMTDALPSLAVKHSKPLLVML